MIYYFSLKTCHCLEAGIDTPLNATRYTIKHNKHIVKCNFRLNIVGTIPARQCSFRNLITHQQKTCLCILKWICTICMHSLSWRMFWTYFHNIMLWPEQSNKSETVLDTGVHPKTASTCMPVKKVNKIKLIKHNRIS